MTNRLRTWAAKLPAIAGGLVIGALGSLRLIERVLIAVALIAVYWLIVARPLKMRGSRRALGIVVTLALIPYALGALWLGLAGALWLGILGWLLLLFALRRMSGFGGSASSLVVTSAACGAGFALGFSIEPIKNMISPPHLVDVHVENRCSDEVNLRIGPFEIGDIDRGKTHVSDVPAVVVHLRKEGTTLRATGGLQLTATLDRPFAATIDGKPIGNKTLSVDLGTAKTHSLVLKCSS